MKTILYYLVKAYIKTGLFFYSKKIKVVGSKNVPKKGAVLFLANHPNGLIDPLFIATNTSRKTYFLVRAAVFKNKIIAYLFDLIGMMPIYRIRDGIKELSKNDAIFNKCYDILGKQKTLLIFPEGSHDKRRTVRPLSKGFTRIVFGTIEKYPSIPIHLIPVGITYQNVSSYPSKVAIHYGKPILANDYYDTKNTTKAANDLKKVVREQLEKLTVHIPENDYTTINNRLNEANIDFTEVTTANNLISTLSEININPKKKRNPLFYFLLIINSLIPFFLWKKIGEKVDEIEFIDTFRFGINIILFPLFYTLQAFVLYKIVSSIEIAIIYFVISFLIVLLNSKSSPTNTE